jgi:hypothetical protein
MNGTELSALELLVLAGLSYRGFSDPLQGPLHDSLVSAQVSRGLQTLAPVKDRWDLVWGPVTARTELFVDSSGMFVVRSRSAPQHYVVSVRGTNPLSLADWLLGDFAVRKTVPWPFSEEGAEVSASTWLGVQTLLHMRSTADANRLVDRVTETVLHAAAPLVDGAEALVRRLGATGRSVRWIPESLEQAFTARIVNLAARLDVTDHGGTVLTAAAEAQVRRQFEALQKGAAEVADGQSLVEFLAAASQKDGPLEIVVTGHSKGGALAPALALWLKDTQRAHAGRDGWDASGRSLIECVTFAGPTPGNRAFAARIDAELGPRHRRIVNTNDFVTHAWETTQLRQLSGLYSQRSAPLARLLQSVASETESLDYQHASTGVLAFPGTLDRDRRPLLTEELIYQHMDAYLDRFGLLSQGIDALELFAG